MSIFLVLGAHSCHLLPNPCFHTPVADHLLDGDLGVRCFFLISGLLITWLLLEEYSGAGTVSLKHFYIRRALRILPVYFAFLGILGLVQKFTTFSQTRVNWIADLTFTANFIYPSWLSGHLWSLSVEEQFYLVWPLMLVMLRLPIRPGLAFKVLCVPLVMAPICRLAGFKHLFPSLPEFLFSHFSFFGYFDCLATGCVCAFLLRHKAASIKGLVSRRPLVATAIGVLLLLTPLYLLMAHARSSFNIVLTPTCQSAGLAILIMQSIVNPSLGFYKFLNWPVVRHIGVLSYSIYIWQNLFWPVHTVFGGEMKWWFSFPGWLVPVLVVSHVSYYLLERPFFNLRSRFR